MTLNLIWLSITSFFKKVKKWCVEYWQILVGAFATLFAFMVFKGDSSKKVLDKSRESHEKEIETLLKIKNKEVSDHKEAAKKYVNTLKKVEEKYGKIEKDLDVQKKLRIAELIDSNKDNPEEITDEIAEIMGFRKYN